MAGIPRLGNPRRRSHSISIPSSPTPRRDLDESHRASTKRARYAFSPPHSDPTSPQKWDLDVWRRGKRRRQDISPTNEGFDLRKHGYPPPLSHRSSSCSTPHKPAFPTTSEEFDFFPRKARRRSDVDDVSRDDPMDDESGTDLARLRSHAFWELRRSVEENGEGFIRRMREYEESRSRPDSHQKLRDRGRKRTPLISRSRKVIDYGDSDEDVQILAGNPLASRRFSDAESTRSAGVLSSPGTTCASSISGYPSDEDEYPHRGGVFFGPGGSFNTPTSIPTSTFPSALPALSHSYATSANPSLTSLRSQPSTSQKFTVPSSTTFAFTPKYGPIHPSSGRTEKAIAALTLAMANGAGGLNDYGTLTATQNLPASEDFQVGELWR